ncbi:MAG: hypothetical protein JWM09_515 [Francisellaceae bacterium]|nr:hypothetical protein [Francisellaceae bacterium]
MTKLDQLKKNFQNEQAAFILMCAQHDNMENIQDFLPQIEDEQTLLSELPVNLADELETLRIEKEELKAEAEMEAKYADDEKKSESIKPLTEISKQVAELASKKANDGSFNSEKYDLGRFLSQLKATQSLKEEQEKKDAIDKEIREIPMFTARTARAKKAEGLFTPYAYETARAASYKRFIDRVLEQSAKNIRNGIDCPSKSAYSFVPSPFERDKFNVNLNASNIHSSFSYTKSPKALIKGIEETTLKLKGEEQAKEMVTTLSDAEILKGHIKAGF